MTTLENTARALDTEVAQMYQSLGILTMLEGDDSEITQTMHQGYLKSVGLEAVDVKAGLKKIVDVVVRAYRAVVKKLKEFYTYVMDLISKVIARLTARTRESAIDSAVSKLNELPLVKGTKAATNAVKRVTDVNELGQSVQRGTERLTALYESATNSISKNMETVRANLKQASEALKSEDGDLPHENPSVNDKELLDQIASMTVISETKLKDGGKDVRYELLRDMLIDQDIVVRYSESGVMVDAKFAEPDTKVNLFLKGVDGKGLKNFMGKAGKAFDTGVNRIKSKLKTDDEGLEDDVERLVKEGESSKNVNAVKKLGKFAQDTLNSNKVAQTIRRKLAELMGRAAGKTNDAVDAAVDNLEG